MTYKSVSDKKTGGYVETSSPGFLISMSDHPNHKVKFFEREHARLINFTSVVTVQNIKIKSFTAIMLYVATAQSDNKSLHHCTMSVVSLFTKSKKPTATSMYPFNGLDKIGYVSIAVAVKESGDLRRIVADAAPGYDVSDVTTSVRDDKYYVYDFVLYDKSVTIAQIQRASGLGGSINLTFVNVKNVEENPMMSDAASI